MEKPQINKILMDLLKLDESETITYLTVLNYGPLTLGEISAYANIEYLELTLCIEKLKKRKLIVELPGVIKNYQALPPYKGFLEKLTSLERNIGEIIKKMESLSTDTENQIEEIAQDKLNQITREFTTNTQTIKTKTELLKKSAEDSIKISKNNVNKQLNILKEELNTIAEKHLQEFNKIILQIKEDINSKVSNINAEILEISRKNKSDLNTKVDEFLQMSKEDTQKVIENTITIFNDVLNSFSNEIINLRQSFSQSIIEFLNKFKDMSVEVEKLSRDLFKNFNETSANIISEVQTSFKNHIERSLNESIELSGSFNKKFVGTIENLNSIIENEVDNLHTKEVELIGGLLKVITDLISSFDNDIIASLETGKSKVLEFSNTLEEDINEIFKTYFNTLNENIDDLKKVFQENLVSLNTTIFDMTDSLNKEIIEGLSQHLDKFSNISRQFEVNLTDDLKDNLNKYKDAAASFLSQFTDILKSKLDKAKEGLNRLKTEILLKIEETQSQFQKKFQKLNQDLKQLIKTQIETVDTNIGPIQSKFSEIINTEIQNILEDTESIKSESISFLQDSRTVLNSQINFFKEEVENLIQKIFKQIDLQVASSQEKLQSLENNFNKIFEKRIQNIIESTQKFDTKLKEEFKNQYNIIAQAASIIEENMAQTISEISSNYNILIENIKSAVSAELTREISNSEELLSFLLTNFDKNISENLEYIKYNVDDLINNITTTISTIIEESRNLHEMYSQKAEEMIKFQNSTCQQRNDLLINEINKIGSTYFTRSQDDFQQKLTFFIQNLTKIKNDFIETMTIIENKIRKKLALNSKILTDSLMNINKNLTGTLVQLKEKSSDILLNFKNESNISFEDYINNMKSKSIALENTFTDSFNTLRNHIKNFLRELQSESLTLYSNKISIGTKLITTVRDNLEANLENANIKLKEVIKSPQTKLENIAAKNAQNLEKFQKSFNESIENSLQWVYDEYRNLNTNLIESIDGLIKDHTDQSQLISENSMKNVELRINDQKLSLENILSEIYNSIKKSIDVQENEMINLNMQSIKKIEEYISQNKKIISDQISITTKEFINQINEVKNETVNYETLLRNIWTESLKMQKTRETKTWKIKTLTAVIEHIKDMLSRTKSSIILIIPDSTKIPFAILSKIKLSIDVKIYTEVTDTLLETEEMKRLLKMDNILIFHIEENYYAAFRDKEEVLIAPNEKDENNVSGIISVQKGHVDLFFNIIGPMYDSKAKKIEK